MSDIVALSCFIGVAAIYGIILTVEIDLINFITVLKQCPYNKTNFAIKYQKSISI